MKKFIYLSIISIIALAFSSCSDDERINTTSATVAMGETTYSIKENKKLFNVPVVVDGEQNGDIRVIVDVKCEGDDCVENKHFIVTSKNIVIPRNKKSVNVEIKAVDDRVINPDRKFSVSIVSVEGATVDKQRASTLVTLLDNDNVPYERLAGTWVVTAYAEDPTFTDNPAITTWETVITTVDEGNDGYGSEMTMSPWVMSDYTMLTHPMKFTYNQAAETATVSLPLGSTMGSELNFGTDDLGNDFTSSRVVSATIGMSLVTTGQVTGTVSSDYSTIVFNMPFVGMIFNDQGQTAQSVVDGVTYFAPMFLFYRMELRLKE